MKAKHPNSNPSSRKQKNTSNDHNKPVRKEFQLLYRSRGGLPSSEQYESVIFMKHKHISPEPIPQKDKPKKTKKKTKQKKKSEESQKIGKKLEDKTKQKFYQSPKLENTKSTVPFMTQGNFTNGKLFSESFRETIDMQKTKLRKIGNLSNSNSSRYLDSKYIVKSSKKKVKNQKSTKSIDPSKTAKASSRGQSKMTSPKNIQSNRIKNNAQISQEQNFEYVFINGEFVKGKNSVFAQIQKKVIEEKEHQRNQFLSNNSISQNKGNQNPSQSFESSNTQSITELSTIKSFINFKVITIQRWWRSILINRNIVQNSKKNIQAINSQILKEQNSQSEISTSCQNITPQINLSSYLSYHENTVLNYMNSQKNVLTKLKQNNKITQQEFIGRLNEIESNFQNEILALKEMRNKFQNQMTKMKHFQEKISEQSQISQRISSMKAEDVLAKFFTKQNKENFNLQNIYSEVKDTKRKSNGCHFSDEKIEPPMVTQTEREIFQRDSGDENQQTNDKLEEEDQQIQLSNALQGNFDNLVEAFQDQQRIQAELQKRYAIQVGMLLPDDSPNQGISTSVMAVHKFLTNFLKFYEYFYKDEFLKLVNMPYGQNPKKRLKNIQRTQQGQHIEQEQQGIIYGLNQIISSEALEDYHEHNYNNLDTSDEQILMMVCYEKIHNKLIIDSFNQCINQFRPYYFVDGPPYLWNYSEKALTFYFIAEQNIQEVFQKTQYKVLRNASSLCGMMVDGLSSTLEPSQDKNLTDIMVQYRSCVNPMLMQSRQQKLSKAQKLQTEQTEYKWHINEQQKTSTLIDMSNVIFVQLILEACCELSSMQE